MNLPTVDCARAVRDGGIDAMAALDHALNRAVATLPAESRQALTHAFGQVMGHITHDIIQPAVRAFPELDPDEATWAEVARARAVERSNAV